MSKEPLDQLRIMAMTRTVVVCFTVGIRLLFGLVGPQLSTELLSFQVASPLFLTG